MRRVRSRRCAASVVAAAALLPVMAAASDAPSAAGQARSPSQAEAAAPGGAQEPVELDRLLRLPDDFDVGGQRRGGATAAEWKARFRKARSDLEEARKELRETQAQLENAAGESGDYQVAAPGATDPTNSPVNFGLRQELRRRREQVEREERSLRDLAVEADLADVPEDWRN